MVHLFKSIGAGIVFSGCVAVAISWLLVLTQRWHGTHSHDTGEGPQKFHTVLTPRIGGLAIFGGLVAACFFASGEVAQLLGWMLIAALPAFAAGLAEDLTKRVSALKRLLATVISGLIAWWTTGYTLSHLDAWVFDYLLLYLFVSGGFTAFAVAGVANAVNMIDGFNGLASGSLMISLFALALIAYEVDDDVLVILCLTVMVVLSGFMLLNYPFGKIFMGDGGAYLLGFFLAWIAVMLPTRNQDVSPWASLIVCAYPINEALFTMVRRFWNREAVGLPDVGHLHSLVKLKIIRPRFADWPPVLRNSLVAPLCWIYGAAVALAGVFLYQHTSLLMISWIGSFMLYLVLYFLLSRMKTPLVRDVNF